MPSVPLVPFENTPYSDPLFPGIPIPTSNPQDEPKVCLTYNQDWQPILVALASRLTRRDAWQGDEAAQLLGTRKGHELIAQIQLEHCPEGATDGLCTEYLPLNPFTTYFPLSPYADTEFIPPGYQRRPFYTNVTNILFDIQPTDVICDILAIDPLMTLPELLNFSLPRIHIDLEGSGKAELHFLLLPQGGWCTVTIDGNPLQAKIVDLNAIALTDIQSILGALGIVVGGGLAKRFTHELEFTTLGEHTIDITFFPHFGGDVILGFGGGFAGLEFCSSSIDGDQRYMAVSGIRINTETCEWEEEFNGDGIWIPFADVFQPLCMPAAGGLVRDPGDGQLEQSTDGGTIWADIPNAHFLHINTDNDPLTGGLSIEGVTDEIKLSIKGVGAPYQTAKLAVFKDADNIERAWINPRGDAYFSDGVAPGSNALELGGSALLPYLGALKWRTSEESISRNVISSNGADQMTFRARAGYIWYDDTPNMIASIISGIYFFKNTASGGRTLYFINAGAGQGTNSIFHIQQADYTPLLEVKHDGLIEEFVRNSDVDTQSNALTLDHETTSTPIAEFGTGLRLRAKSSTTASREQVRIRSQWSEATDATRKAEMVISAYDTAERELMRGGGNGTEPTLAVLGQAPSPRVDVGVIDCAGNDGAKAALDALVTFGWIEGTINLGSVPATEPGLSQRPSRCQTAVMLANWIFHHSYAMASREAWYTDALYFVGDRTDSIKKMLDVAVEETTNLLGWVNLENADFTLQSGATQEQHLLDMQAYFESIAFQEAIYCALKSDPSPYMDATDYLGLLELLEAMAVVGQPSDYAFEFMRCFNEESIAVWASQAALSSYFNPDADCSAFSCGETLPDPPAHDWCATYDFRQDEFWINESPDPKWDSFGGSYVSGQGWLCDRTGAPPQQGTGQVFLTKTFAIAPTIVQYRVKIGFMEVDPEGLGQNIVIYRAHASETDNIPIDMEVGEKTYISQFGSANSEINVWLASNPLDVIYIRSITIYGTGSQPSDIDGMPCP